MSGSPSNPEQFSNPSLSWPFTFADQADPPWRMAGRVCTAWFDVTHSSAEILVDSALLPQQEKVRARLRFYDLRATNDSGEVPFREAVVAFVTTFNGVQGEVSVRMWSDSWAYTSWGRDRFGWPIELGAISLQGGFWNGENRDPGSARLEAPSLAISDLLITDELPNDGGSSMWIIPRRFLHRTETGWTEYRDVHGLVPGVAVPGHRYRCTGEVDVSSLFETIDIVTIDCAEGFELEIGLPELLLEREVLKWDGHMRAPAP
jgi:hypothetical protein